MKIRTYLMNTVGGVQPSEFAMDLHLNSDKFLHLDEAIASVAVFVIVSGSGGRMGRNAFGAC